MKNENENENEQYSQAAIQYLVNVNEFYKFINGEREGGETDPRNVRSADTQADTPKSISELIRDEFNRARRMLTLSIGTAWNKNSVLTVINLTEDRVLKSLAAYTVLSTDEIFFTLPVLPLDPPTCSPLSPRTADRYYDEYADEDNDEDNDEYYDDDEGNDDENIVFPNDRGWGNKVIPNFDTIINTVLFTSIVFIGVMCAFSLLAWGALTDVIYTLLYWSSVVIVILGAFYTGWCFVRHVVRKIRRFIDRRRNNVITVTRNANMHNPWYVSYSIMGDDDHENS